MVGGKRMVGGQVARVSVKVPGSHAITARAAVGCRQFARASFRFTAEEDMSSKAGRRDAGKAEDGKEDCRWEKKSERGGQTKKKGGAITETRRNRR